MRCNDVINVINLLEQDQIDVWLDGGWGIDALLGEQTRSHADVDIVIRHSSVPRLLELLALCHRFGIDMPDDYARWTKGA